MRTHGDSRPDGIASTRPTDEGTDSRPPSLSTRTFALLLLVTAFSLWLRCGSIARLLPVQPEPDASLVWVYREMAGEATPHPHLHAGVYPPLVPFVAARAFGADALRVAPEDAALDEHLRAASAAYLHVRWVVALLSFLIAPLTFFVARRWIADPWALAAAAMVASALLHVAHSPVAKAHAAGATLLWLAILCALRQLERPSFARVAATACAAALAVGTIHSGLFAVPVMLGAALLGWPRTSSRGVRCAAWVAPGLVLLVGMLFSSAGIQVADSGVRMGAQGHLIEFRSLTGSGLWSWSRTFWEHDPVLAVLAACGLFAVVRHFATARRDALARGRWLLLSCYVLPYAAVISLDAKVADRYLLPLYPFFALSAAMAARALFGRLRGKAPRALAVGLVLAAPAWIGARFTWLGNRPTTVEQLGTWLAAQPQATQSKVLLSPALTPPLFPTRAALDVQLESPTTPAQPWFYYLGKLERLPTTGPGYDLRPIRLRIYGRDPPWSEEEIRSYFDAEDPDLIVLESTLRVYGFPGARVVDAVVREHGERVAVFSGERGRRARETSIDYQNARELARRVLTASAFGPHVEVYRWRRP